jgi:hypothetical protein
MPQYQHSMMKIIILHYHPLKTTVTLRIKTLQMKTPRMKIMSNYHYNLHREEQYLGDTILRVRASFLSPPHPRSHIHTDAAKRGENDTDSIT